MRPHTQTLPLVTVAVVCYNQARFVVEALESVKALDYPNLHLVVLDDCSRDDSVEVIRRWLNTYWPESVFLAHKTNMGVCCTVNEALANAKGKYMRLLAADDRWMPNTLSRMVEAMEAVSESVGVIYSDAFQMDEDGELLPEMFIEANRSFTEMPEGWIFDTLLEGNFIPGMTAVIRLDCLKAVGGCDESLVSEDWDMWLRIARQFKFKYFAEPTAYYRLVRTSMTRTLAAEVVDSERRMFVKYLRRGWLAGESEYLAACRAYRQGLPGRAYMAAQAFRHRACVKRAVLLLFVTVGLPFRRFEQVIKLLGNINRRAKSFLVNRGIRRELR